MGSNPVGPTWHLMMSVFVKSESLSAKIGSLNSAEDDVVESPPFQGGSVR